MCNRKYGYLKSFQDASPEDCVGKEVVDLNDLKDGHSPLSEVQWNSNGIDFK
ncbi:hypothetical protein O9G_006100, partial [Rozella allomycis CSF55]